MTDTDLALRSIVAEVVREIVAETKAQQLRSAETLTGDPLTMEPLRGRVQTVRIVDNKDLDLFTRQLITLFENPKNRQDLRAGRLRFALDATSTRNSQSTSQPMSRIESGAVTERHVKEAADRGQRIFLGRRAVLTPLGREKARALGVPIEKEQ